jgi:hypothetical protein
MYEKNKMTREIPFSPNEIKNKGPASVIWIVD